MSEPQEEGVAAAAVQPLGTGGGDGSGQSSPVNVEAPAEAIATETSPSTVKGDEAPASPTAAQPSATDAPTATVEADNTEAASPPPPPPQPSPVEKAAPPAKEDESKTPPPPTQPGPRPCGVCNTQSSKYKCPRCTLPYCSVACNRVHKETHPADEPLPKPAPPPPPPPQEPLDPYSILLEHRSEFDRLFKKYPRLQSHLLEINAATLDPDAPAANGGTNLLYQQAQQALRQATAGMGGGGGKKNKQEMWTREVGLRTGAAALRQARTDPGDKGDGVREFCDLVLYLLSVRDEEEQQRGGGFEDLGWNKTTRKRKWEGGGLGRLNSAVDIAREAALKEDRAVMKRLMEEEGYERELRNLGMR